MINLILFCLGTASLTHFLSMCFQKGMIFRKYYNWITYWFALDKESGYKNIFIKRPTIKSNVIPPAGILTGGFLEELMNPEPVKWYYGARRYKKNDKVWLWKVLAGCYFCYGTWVFIVLYLLTMQGISTQILLGIGFNYVFIKVIERIH
jgi:hypothetical protein